MAEHIASRGRDQPGPVIFASAQFQWQTRTLPTSTKTIPTSMKKTRYESRISPSDVKIVRSGGRDAHWTRQRPGARVRLGIGPNITESSLDTTSTDRQSKHRRLQRSVARTMGRATTYWVSPDLYLSPCCVPPVSAFHRFNWMPPRSGATVLKNSGVTSTRSVTTRSPLRSGIRRKLG